MGAVRELWLRWKMLHLPWRKKFFVGRDLTGNTFWEFRDPQTKNRLRRIVHRSPYLPKSHYADVQITPQWHQWLRQTRIEAPTFEEQRADLLRQSQLKINAQLADQRWESKAKYIEDKPKSTLTQPTTAQPMLRGDVRLDAAHAETKAKQEQAPSRGGHETAALGTNMKTAIKSELSQPQAPQESAQKQIGANPGATFQPESWTPGSGGRPTRSRT